MSYCGIRNTRYHLDRYWQGIVKFNFSLYHQLEEIKIAHSGFMIPASNSSMNVLQMIIIKNVNLRTTPMY